MRIATLAAALALTAAAPAPQKAPLPLKIGGRIVPEADGSVSFGWPGTYFEGRFRGTAVRVRFVAATDFFRLLIDGHEMRRFEKPGAVDAVIDGLTAGDHVVRLAKLTENQHGEARFIGFYPAAGSIPLPIVRAPRAIEFVGDSYTVGYGNTSTTRTCTQDAVHDTTDTQAAFGPIVARHYDADYRINAYSGIGVVRNYNGITPDIAMPLLYRRLKPSDAARWESSVGDWRPQMIVVNLGTNDFSTRLHAGERWADDAALRADYRRQYVTFVTRLAATQPQARFVLMGSPDFYADVEAVAATIDARWLGRATPLLFDGLARDGCDSHPSLADDRLLARLIEGAIDRIEPGWATTQDGEPSR
ncbi:SGNH/GDSL hydrolase family protein [Sphingomonas sp.]|uniref:SGNH/GDSL hydrolase family protein n=1 Tax=Sphingomonas sp. TaxID=28214 RepID=UPI0025E5FB63|nr:SGNH/GDSL hydrolase family protein [Sphingomonas sp.]